ncbi:hypothetical protein ACLQ2R_16800 [Streptosporangium sp. DT93]|uniref:hypothetical protein n=1 Tax=Streptosporangium sp. DT93 TaxID=3393428 RepID=UPI003CEF471D
MSLKNRFTRATAGCAFAVAAVLTLGAFSPVPPPVGPDRAYAPQVPRVAEAAEPAGSSRDLASRDLSPGELSPRAATPPPVPAPRVRALSAEEIRTRGLDRYIDMSRQRETSPTVIDASRTGFPGGVLVPSRRPAGYGVSDQRSGCWYLTTTYGPPSLRGAAHHTWCGDGIRVTYTSAGCTGTTSLPTSVYEGCETIQRFGAGWNAWDVTDRWRFCTSYHPYTGTCSERIHPWQRNRYGANGQVWTLGWGD